MPFQPENTGATAPEKPKLQVNPGACIGCGYCESVCPTGAISLMGVANINPSICIGCGSCAGRCPMGAIT